MTQMAPSVLLYGQAMLLLKELNDALSQGGVKTNLEIEAKINDILTRFRSGAGVPLTEWNPIVETEPPVSTKMNRFWRQIQSDVALMQQQVDVLRAASIFAYNFLTTEIEKSSQQNAVLRNKIKTLQLYSDSVDTSIVLFGDNFHTNDYIDTNQTLAQSRAHIESEHFLTLGRLGDYVNLAPLSSVRVLETSNGFNGNNQEVKDPVNAPTNPITGEKTLTFLAEQGRNATLAPLLDGKPVTWFEYEHWKVKENTRQTYANLNFNYAIDSGEGLKLVDWGLGPTNNVLKLDLEFNLKAPQKVNQITYTPYGLTDNVNFPVKVALVEISGDGTVWSAVSPANIWIGTDVNLQAARTADTVVTRKAIWTFQEQMVQFIRIHVEQPNSVTRPMGHVAWYEKDNLATRADGPDPNLLYLERYYSPSFSTSGNLLQKREWSPESRWAIGVRDITIEQIRYSAESIMVTKPIRAGGFIDRVALQADIYIPPAFSDATNWVRFFVSPDNGTNWHEISRIQDDFMGLPEVLAFNDPTPEAFREPGVSYVNTGGDVTEIRFKIVLSRPSTLPASTPIVRSYKLKIKRR